MTERFDVFLSYSRTDRAAAALLRQQLQRAGLSVYQDVEALRYGDLWLQRLQQAIEGSGAFVVLVGRDGVRRWVAAETQMALSRHFETPDDADRLPLFPILLNDASPEVLPGFLRLFQASVWDGEAALAVDLVDQIRTRRLSVSDAPPIDACPFKGLAAFGVDDAHLFFGRQRDILDALACFDARPGAPPVRWLEINGGSGSGKSSLMNAGLLPLIEQGWLWPRTGVERWRRIGPLMPGERPLEMLAEHLARAFEGSMADIRRRLATGNGQALAEWLRERKPDDETAYLIAVDQFEELFTVARAEERRSLDALLAGALEDPSCPLYLVTTIRSDFLVCLEAAPRLLAARNRLGRPWTLPLVDANGLREIIDGPARLAGIDAGEVREAIVAEAGGEPGALPLVQHGLAWLWEHRVNGVLSGRLLRDQGGLAGILSDSADRVLDALGSQRDDALELLYNLAKIDLEGHNHMRRRIPLSLAVEAAGGDGRGRDLVDRLAGARQTVDTDRATPLRLVTIRAEAAGAAESGESEGSVEIIHETLIRRRPAEPGKPAQPYWPTLWNYLERQRNRAARRERLYLQAFEWNRRRGLARLFGLAGWGSLLGVRGVRSLAPLERRFIAWSRRRAAAELALMLAIAGLVGEAVVWQRRHEQPVEALVTRWAYVLGAEVPLPEMVSLTPASIEEPARAGGRGQASLPAGAQYATAFDMSATEITVAQYDAFRRATGDTPSEPDDQADADLPVANVDWGDAQRYARWLGAMTGRSCRLPYGAEWISACLAGREGPFGLDEAPLSGSIEGLGLANCLDCGSASDAPGRVPVAQFYPNAWGLHDMHGNVQEWTHDECSHPALTGSTEGGGGDAICMQAARGGSYSIDSRDTGCDALRTYDVGRRASDVGFRVLCEARGAPD